MKTIFKIFLLISVFAASNAAYPQSGELSITQSNDGSVIGVSIFIKRTSVEPWNLGFASLVFNYNSSAMSNPSELTEGLWDNDISPDYDDQIISNYAGGNSVSVEIGLDSITATGSEVPTDPVLVGSVRFDITNPAEMHNIIWNNIYSAILDKNGNNVTSNIIFINPPNELLPVEFVSFSASVINNNVNLNWITSGELNNSGFQIERAEVYKETEENPDWQRIGFVNGRGNTNENTVYNYKDKILQSGKYAYRLKQLDYNGNFTFYRMQELITIGVPDKFMLSQNYPNPFNPVTKISYEIRITSYAQIKIFDVSGKEVTELINQKQEAGSYEVDFKAADFASGIYFYSLLIDGKVIDTKRMILIK